jgi:hypothetical protein
MFSVKIAATIGGAAAFITILAPTILRILYLRRREGTPPPSKRINAIPSRKT